MKRWEKKKNRKLYIGVGIFIFGDRMAKIELEDGEEVVERIVTKFGRIEGMKRWMGMTVRIIISKKDDKE